MFGSQRRSRHPLRRGFGGLNSARQKEADRHGTSKKFSKYGRTGPGDPPQARGSGPQPARCGGRDGCLRFDSLALENGTGKPDADNIARLTGWLDMPMERIMSGRQITGDEAKAVIYFPQEATPNIVEAHLRADRNLTPETATALSELFRVAYAQFSHPGAETRGARNKRK